MSEISGTGLGGQEGLLASAVACLQLAESLGGPSGCVEIALAQVDYIEGRRRGVLPLHSAKPRPRLKLILPPPLTDEELGNLPSPWDPEGPEEFIDAGHCRALLLEVLRRAIHDWVLYRNNSELELRERAESAFIWLFEEGPGHAWWIRRMREGCIFTSLVGICEVFDFDIEYVRRKARETTVKKILTTGRHAERRRIKKDILYTEHSVEGSLGSASFDALDAPRGCLASDAEGHFSAYTPDYL